MVVSSRVLTKAWIGVLIYLGIISLIGAVAIPTGEMAIQWSWGDWKPVGHASKPWGLSLGPLVATVIAVTAVGRRRAADLEFAAAPFVWAEILAMVVMVAAHTLIVLAAI